MQPEQSDIHHAMGQDVGSFQNCWEFLNSVLELSSKVWNKGATVANGSGLNGDVLAMTQEHISHVTSRLTSFPCRLSEPGVLSRPIRQTCRIIHKTGSQSYPSGLQTDADAQTDENDEKRLQCMVLSWEKIPENTGLHNNDCCLPHSVSGTMFLRKSWYTRSF